MKSMNKKIPVIDLSILQKEEDFQKELFWEYNFPTDIYKSLYFDSLETYKGLPWQNEEEINKRNKIRLFLQKKFPFTNYCIVDLRF